MSENTVAVNDDSFEAQVLNAKGPVLVDFWAEWCGPCKMIAPVLEEIAFENKGKHAKVAAEDRTGVADVSFGTDRTRVCGLRSGR